MRRFLASGLAAVALLGACGSGDDDAAEAPDPPPETVAPTTTTTRPQSDDVETREETYVDASRPTQAFRDYAGAPDRTLRVVFHVPSGDGPFPLVLFSHGLGATPEAYAPLLDVIASAGYVVAAPAYPLSNGNAVGGGSVVDTANQPADASFVLDEVLAASDDDASWLAGLVDAEHIALGGHSLGGITTLGFFNSCCADDRVDAAFPISGRVVNFPGTAYAGIAVPVLLIHGDHDELVPYASSEEAYANVVSPKYLLTLVGGTHSGILRAEQGAITTTVILDFLDGYLKDDAAALDDITEDGNVEGVATLVSA